MAANAPAQPPADTAPCPCGSPATYSACCRRLHRGDAQALTADELMRSRYSAFAVGDGAYLLHSWHPSTRPRRIGFVDGQRWTGLDVRSATGGALDRQGTVDFVASYERSGVAGELHEVSAFSRHEGRWVYVGPSANGG